MSNEAMNTSTGELVTIPAKFEMGDYLSSLTARDAFKEQNNLAAAYDSACAALIGPNDVQKAEGRTFKKKSAWRKLARYFNISVEIVKVEREMLDGLNFCATVTARAVAPWGQAYEEVGACSQDEATGKRSISIADAIATASTRASNRAVSNLIAMGEVSAEEIGERKPYGERPANTASAKRGVLPFGKSKGTPLAELDIDNLQSAYEWARLKDKYTEFQEEAVEELEKRRVAAQDVEAEQPHRVQASESGSLIDDELPF